MKKLMFATVAAIATTAAVAEIGSNTVGYNTESAVVNEINTLAPMFVRVGGEPIRLSDMTVSGYQDGSGEYEIDNGIVIAELNSSGAVLKEKVEGEWQYRQYNWNDIVEYCPAGWYDNSYRPMVSEEEFAAIKADYPEMEAPSYWGDAKNITFPQGAGFRMTVKAAGLTLTMSGEVKKMQFELHDLIYNEVTTCGNPYAVPINLSQIKVKGYQDESGEYEIDNGIVIAELNTSGAVLKEKVEGEWQYRQYNWNEIIEYCPAGWYDNNYQPLVSAEEFAAIKADYPEMEAPSYWGDAKNIIFNPGKGFRVTLKLNGYEDVYLEFPDPKID